MSITRRLLVVLLLAVLTPVLLADSAEDAARNTARARALLNEALDDARDAQDNLNKLNDTLNTALSRQRDLTDQIDKQQQQQKQIAKRRKEAQAALPGLEKDLAAAQQAADRAAAPLADAKQQYEQDQAAVTAVHQKAADAFHAGPPYQQVDAAAKAAAEAIDTATTICINKLEASQEYRAALKAYDDAVAELNKVKKALPPGHPRLVTASQKMIDADSTVRRMRIDTVAHDPAINAAKRQSEKAAADLNALETQFEKQIVLQPDMVAATNEADKSRMLMLVAQNTWKQADTAREQAQTKVSSARDDIESAKTKLADLDTAIANAQRELDRTASTITLTRRQITAAEQAVREAERRVEVARRIYEQARANETRTRNR